MLLKNSCERRLDAASESATAEAKQAHHFRGTRSAIQALSLTQLNGMLLEAYEERDAFSGAWTAPVR